MTGNSNDRSKPPSERERRDARLAAALRTNLKRRKTTGQGKPPAKPDPDAG